MIPQVQIVNGYVCFDCADVALAQKDVNPAHPPGSPSNPTGSTPNGPDAPSASAGTSQSASAVVFGGSVARLAAGAAPSASPPPYQPGAAVSLTA